MAHHTLLVGSGLVQANGGIQTVAKLSWDAVGRVGPRSLISFGPVDSSDAGNAARSVITTSKPALLTRVALRTWPAEIGLFTHIELLKLLPLLRRGPRRIVAFIMGIEAWRPLGWMTRRMLRRVDLLLSISQHTWERFVSYNPEFRTHPHTVLYLGMGQTVACNLFPPDHPPIALILGRMAKDEDYKGHRELITAWPRVQKLLPDARLWVVGDGNLRPELEALAEKVGFGKLITFFGRVSEERKQELIRQSQCLVMPSRGEGFGLVYLEAMRLGRPCLVSDQGAGCEVVNPSEAGLAVDPSDLDALAAAVAQLLTRGPRWDAWSAAARHRYAATFTRDHFQGRLLDVLFGSVTVARS